MQSSCALLKATAHLCTSPVHSKSLLLLCRYAYYLVSSLGVRCPTPVKKSITLLQMVQFGLLNAQVRFVSSLERAGAPVSICSSASFS